MRIFQAKISVKFVKGWPAVGRVRLCFAHPPDVTLTARPMTKKGMDMNSVPGAANWLVIQFSRHALCATQLTGQLMEVGIT